jgi:hypothetical protein
VSEKNDKPLASYFSIVLAIVLVVGSAGWFFRNLGVIVGPFFDKEDPVPTATPPALDGAVEAVLYAECQEQLRDALEGMAPTISEQEVAANEEYLDEARRAVVRLEDLIFRGQSMFDELQGRDGDTPEDYREEWNERARKFRSDLFDSMYGVRRLGMSDSFTRLQSEIFLAYHWLDRYSDEINSFFTDQQYGGLSDNGINMSGRHLETASTLLKLIR